jgi:hypothetical protein
VISTSVCGGRRSRLTSWYGDRHGNQRDYGAPPEAPTGLGSPRGATGADDQAAVEICLAVLEAGRSGRPVATGSAREPMRAGKMNNAW